MTRGDHIYVSRAGYTHHGIDVGAGRVIHYSGEPGKSKAHATIRHATLQEFAQGSDVKVRNYGKRFGLDETALRAESKLGECDYDLLGRNCEHLASWCVTGRNTSGQVIGAVAVAGLGTATAAAAAASVGVVGAAGAAAGLSGAGVMSGLAAAGGLVGGGAVAGLAVLGAAPGFVGAGIMQVALADDENFPEAEREARSIGRKAAVAGAAASSVGGIAAVSVLGTAGLSAAGITSGLATVGAAVGGGMVAGSAALIAAPAVAAAGVGYGLYRAARWWRSSHRVPESAPPFSVGKDQVTDAALEDVSP